MVSPVLVKEQLAVANIDVDDDDVDVDVGRAAPFLAQALWAQTLTAALSSFLNSARTYTILDAFRMLSNAFSDAFARFSDAFGRLSDVFGRLFAIVNGFSLSWTAFRRPLIPCF